MCSWVTHGSEKIKIESERRTNILNAGHFNVSGCHWSEKVLNQSERGWGEES